jgi:two-component system cell cycle sensor histidine kinase/response regulator CckA
VVKRNAGLLKQALTNQVELAIEYAPSEQPLNVKASNTQLSQVLLNLVINAKDAMLERPKAVQPKITIRSLTKHIEAIPTPGFQRVPVTGESVWHRYIMLPTNNNNPMLMPQVSNYIGISVEDNGPGIPVDQLEHIFEPFFSTKKVGKGTGLGLASCYAIARNNGGWLEVASSYGEGTCFTLYLPAFEDAIYMNTPENGAHGSKERELAVKEQSASRNYRTHQMPATVKTALVVEDDPILQIMIISKLEEDGLKIFGADDGAAALEIYQAQGNSIDLIITDLLLPKLNGTDLISQINQTNPAQKFILMSGFSGEEEEMIRQLEELSHSENVSLLAKPFNFEKLYDTLSLLFSDNTPSTSQN